MESVTSLSLSALAPFFNSNTYTSVFVLVDENTHSHCLSAFHLALNDCIEFEVLEVPAGEDSKNIEICFQLWQALIDLKADRNSCLVCLGGGMITDLGGFVASTFKRGIDFIHIPTSALAMVDASIGGKTGINLAHLKNQVGTFALPKLIIADPRWLVTLPVSELRSGFSEMFKHALISSQSYLHLCLEAELNSESIANLIEESMKIKSDIVQQDPKEKGIRKALNFGHTAGHAFESLSHVNKAPVLHGDAIAWGMRVALKLSASKCGFPQEELQRIDGFLKTTYANHQCRYEANDLWEIMLADKKNENGEVKFVLLKAIGTPVISQTVTIEEFQAALLGL
ncbi:MAG: 3-dehydroquinate synthase [Flavobacteriales bacterium]|jgi:3-dehydroquinate synthase